MSSAPQDKRERFKTQGGKIWTGCQGEVFCWKCVEVPRLPTEAVDDPVPGRFQGRVVWGAGKPLDLAAGSPA